MPRAQAVGPDRPSPALGGTHRNWLVAAVSSLGTLAWLASLGWTELILGPNTLSVGSAALALLPLGFGVAAYRLPLPRAGLWPARWLLLAAYPAALGLGLALHPAAELERALPPLALAGTAIALGAYLAVALLALQPERGALAVQTYPLPDDPSSSARPKRRPRILRALLVASMFAGAFAIAVIAPGWLPNAELQRAWGDAAAAGAVLTAVVGSALAVSVVGLFLGSALRLADAEPTPSAAERRLRVASMLFLSLLGGVVYYTLSP